MPIEKIKGLLEPGNIDLFAQPEVPNPKGGISTVFSTSVGFDGKEFLLPRVTPDGRFLSPDEAIREFKKTKRHLDVFDSPENATAFAKQLHSDYAAGKFRRRVLTRDDVSRLLKKSHIDALSGEE